MPTKETKCSNWSGYIRRYTHTKLPQYEGNILCSPKEWDIQMLSLEFCTSGIMFASRIVLLSASSSISERFIGCSPYLICFLLLGVFLRFTVEIKSKRSSVVYSWKDEQNALFIGATTWVRNLNKVYWNLHTTSCFQLLHGLALIVNLALRMYLRQIVYLRLAPITRYIRYVWMWCAAIKSWICCAVTRTSCTPLASPVDNSSRLCQPCGIAAVRKRKPWK